MIKYQAFRRGIDFILALVLLIATLPLFFAVSVAIAIEMGRPIFFSQLRIGKGEKGFIIYKFRTMMRKCQGSEICDESRITRLGSFLRATSLDELPELVNVLRGDMSLIGPRPLLPEYLPRYSSRQRLRHSVLPGMTGLAQISGRNTLTWSTKFRFDILYVRKVSWKLDFMIFIKTIYVVLAQIGFRKGGERTKFNHVHDW